MDIEEGYQGNDIVLVRKLQIDDVDQDLTNYQFRLGMSLNLEDLSGSKAPTYITNDFPINSSLTNTITRTMIIPDTVSANIPVGTYFYEVQVTDPSGNVDTMELGQFKILARVIE